MRDELILTFDLGTTRLKVAAFDFRGQLVGQVARRNQDYGSGEERWQNADEWWRDACAATRELIAAKALQPGQFRGISLSGRAGAGVFVDDQGQVVQHPWADGRHTTILKQLLGDGPSTSANYGPTLVAKLLWLESNQPEVFASVKHALYGKDFLIFRLTGVAVTDPSSGPDGAWPEPLKRHVDSHLLPAVGMPWTVAGTLTLSASSELGLPEGIPVAVGAHDGVCANAGANALAPGRFALTLGTHAVIRSIVDELPEGARRFYGYPPDQHIVGGNALYAGRALDWFVDTTTNDATGSRDDHFSLLDRQASQTPAGTNGVRFLPFLQGRIAPTRQPQVRAAFTGLGLETDTATQFRAILEGTAFALREVFDQLVSWVGEPRYVGVTGSGARSRLWTRILASVLNTPLTLTDGASEGRGAAIFAAAALGAYPSARDAAANMVEPTAIIEPEKDLVSLYEDAFKHWHLVASTLAQLDDSR